MQAKAILCVLASAFMLAGSGAFGAITDRVVAFSSSGPDRYADGSTVLDGECYALVWSPAGCEFGGFNADGTPACADDRVILAGALAEGGKCPDVIFQIPADIYASLAGGVWAVCLVDTRMQDGSLAGVQDGMPRRVNRWGLVSTDIAITSPDAANLKSGMTRATLAPARAATSGGATVRASRLSSVPAAVAPPRITAIELSDGEVWLSVKDTVPYLSYTIVSGETPDTLKTDYFADVVDGESGAEVGLGTVKSARRRFFRVERAK